MTVLAAFFTGFLGGLALSVYPGSAWRRVLRAEGTPMASAFKAALPLLFLDVLAVAIGFLVLPFLPSLWQGVEAWLVLPFAAFALARGWFLAESGGTLFLYDDQPAPTTATLLRCHLMSPVRCGLRLVIGVAVASQLMLLHDWEVVLAPVLGFSVGYSLAHVILLRLVRVRRAETPFVVSPDQGRIVQSLATLWLFAIGIAPLFFLVLPAVS